MERTTPKVRERVWVEKFDHTTDPPRLVETVFVENGRVIEVTDHTKETENATRREGPAD